MQRLLRRFWSDESGQGLVEYVLIIALVAIGLILIMYTFRDAIGNIFNTISNSLTSAPGSQYGSGGGNGGG